MELGSALSSCTREGTREAGLQREASDFDASAEVALAPRETQVLGRPCRNAPNRGKGPLCLQHTIISGSRLMPGRVGTLAETASFC